jgi:hypothetical protein
MVLRRTRPMRVSELGELTGPHRTPRVVRPMKSTGAFDARFRARGAYWTASDTACGASNENH